MKIPTNKWWFWVFVFPVVLGFIIALIRLASRATGLATGEDTVQGAISNSA